MECEKITMKKKNLIKQKSPQDFIQNGGRDSDCAVD